MAEAAIAEHGIIGDPQTAASVSVDGSVDWFCLQAFTHLALIDSAVTLDAALDRG